MATYTDNYNFIKPTLAEIADIRSENSNMDAIDNILHASQVSLAKAFDQTKAYSTGDVVMYEFLMYKCKADGTTGNWDASKWERTTASESGGGGSAELDILGEGNGAVVSFADGASAELAKCIAEIVPKQAGSGTPSPDNVRAISGYTSVKVDVAGKNLCRVNTGNNVVVAHVKAGQTYTFSIRNQGNCGFNLKKNSSTGEQIARQEASTSSPLYLTFTADEDFDLFLNGFGSGGSTFGSSAYDYQLELGSDATTYEAYAGSTTTTPLGQTVYGGQLNVLTGELTIDRAIITITDESQFATFSADSTYGSLVTIASDGKADNSNIMSISDMALGISNNDRVSPDYVSLDRCYIDDNGRVRLRASKDVTISTKADMLARFLNAQVVYFLATPQTVQLTPQEVNSLLGQNNISADTGDIDIVYVKASAPIKPNPSGTPSGELRSIDIGGEAFSVGLHRYDEAEKLIGYWLGQGLYEKTIDLGSVVTFGTSEWRAVIPHNGEYDLVMHGRLVDPNGVSYNVDIACNDPTYIEIYCTHQLQGRYLTFEYTKSS